MGIPGLQSFIENECPEACPKICINDLALCHRKKIRKSPTLLIDGMALYYRLYTKDLEMLYGGQWIEFTHKLEFFIQQFLNIGVKLIVFFDGTVPAKKRDEWVRRRLDECKKVEVVFSCIKQNLQTFKKKNFAFLIESGVPPCFSTMARLIFKKLGVEIYQTCKEADEEIVEYANTHDEVFGILAQDSDFIIYNTKQYLSLRHLDITNLVTILYDRNCFAEKYLNLDVGQLPLFACLNGNDYIPRLMLKKFHFRLACDKKIHLGAIARNLAQLIQYHGWSGMPDNFKELEQISTCVFGNVQSKNLFHCALQSYSKNNVTNYTKFSIGIGAQLENSVIEKHRKCINNSFIFNVLLNRQLGASTVYEDTSHATSASLLYRQVRQRMYGVIFGGCDGNIEIQEWCAYIGNPLKGPELIKPIYLDGTIFEKMPTLHNVWFQYSEVEKKHIFLTILNAQITLEVLYVVPPDKLAFVVILNYLIGSSDHEPLLYPWEVAVFLVQALHEKSPTYLEKLKVPWSDGRGINLSTLFSCGLALISNILDVCGHPFPSSCVIPSSYFDGKLFHCLYIKAKLKASLRSLCQNKITVIKEFYKLLDLVTNNTIYAVDKLDWKTVFHDFDALKEDFVS